MQTDNVNTYSLNTGKHVIDIVVDPNAWNMEDVADIASSVEETELPVYFSIGPNPVNDVLNVYFLNPVNGMREITIFDLNGRKIYQLSSRENNLRVGTDDFANGVYLISASDGENTLMKRFIK
jgi:hypothetical protein